MMEIEEKLFWVSNDDSHKEPSIIGPWILFSDLHFFINGVKFATYALHISFIHSPLILPFSRMHLFFCNLDTKIKNPIAGK